jgi:electron transfer flavoprotein alpha subunit
MQATNSVLVYLEQRDGAIADVSLELLGKAGDLARQLGVDVEGVLVGHGVQEDPAVLGRYGCRRVYRVEDERLADFTSLPYARAVEEVIRGCAPQIVLFGATTTGRDVAPRVASCLRCGLTADCTELEIGEFKGKSRTWINTLHQIRPAWGGNIIATIVSPESRPSMATVREGVMPMPEGSASSKAEVIDVPVAFSAEDFATQVLQVHRMEREVDLRKARVIVAAGMGASDARSLQLVKDLARVLGGEYAGSRPMVDSGFLPHERQVGQTGTTVRPNLYVACGISGQVQHLAGMQESKRIIAVNSDPEAPIFDIAHYAIVGEVADVLPKMIKAYQAQL